MSAVGLAGDRFSVVHETAEVDVATRKLKRSDVLIDIAIVRVLIRTDIETAACIHDNLRLCGRLLISRFNGLIVVNIRKRISASIDRNRSREGAFNLIIVETEELFAGPRPIPNIDVNHPNALDRTAERVVLRRTGNSVDVNIELTADMDKADACRRPVHITERIDVVDGQGRSGSNRFTISLRPNGHNARIARIARIGTGNRQLPVEEFNVTRTFQGTRTFDRRPKLRRSIFVVIDR